LLSGDGQDILLGSSDGAPSGGGRDLLVWGFGDGPRQTSGLLGTPEAGIRALDEAGQDAALRHYHLFDATLGEFYRRAGNLERARQHFEAARQKTNSPFDRELIEGRLAMCV
jgi:hypothetical protein